MILSFFPLILTVFCLAEGIKAGNGWNVPNSGGLYPGGWSQNPADVVVVHVTKTQFICPCDTTDATRHATNTFTKWTSSTSTLTTYTSTLSGSNTKQTTSLSFTGNPSSPTSVSTTTSTTTSTLSNTLTTTSGGTTTTTSGATTPTTTTTTTLGGTNTTTTTTTTSSPVPTFNFLAFGNPYVVDGTSLGDLFVVSSDRPDRGYANLNNGNTGFYVDSAGALIDSQTGGKAVVINGLNPAPVRFFTQSYIDSASNPDAGNVEICNCSLDSSQNLSCNCNGLTVFAADYRGYLYMQSATSGKKRNFLQRRQSTNSTTTGTAPATIALSATPAATTTATTTTCNLPLQTFNLVSNGSTVTPNSTNVYPVADGTYVKQTDWNATQHYQYAGFRNGSLTDSDPGFYGGTFSYDGCTGIITETTYGRLLTTAPSSTFSAAFFMPLDIIISAGGDLCICNIDQTTFGFTCTCGPNSIFQNPPSGQLYIGSYASVGGSVNYPIARIIP